MVGTVAANLLSDRSPCDGSVQGLLQHWRADHHGLAAGTVVRTGVLVCRFAPSAWLPRGCCNRHYNLCRRRCYHVHVASYDGAIWEVWRVGCYRTALRLWLSHRSSSNSTTRLRVSADCQRCST